MRFQKTRISSPKSRRIRPTTGMVRKVLFDVIGPRIADTAFLDLFAGTGSVGFEAINRGASSAVFVERDGIAVRLLRSNAEAAGSTNHCRIVRADAISYLKRQQEPSELDIVFADPPYQKGYLARLAKHLLAVDRFLDQLVAIQASSHELSSVVLPEQPNLRCKTIGDTVLILREPD